jgi:uncharacterized Ntn-hydrolase superfamily protein
MTFSIVARCARTAELGVAVSTAVPAVGSMCPYLRSGVGAVSTQSWVNPYLAMNALDLLGEGASAEETLASVLQSDRAADLRQVGIVDREGRGAACTGRECTGWAGHRNGAGYTVQGNMLVGAATVDAMVDAFESGEAEPLAERLMRALEAGQAAGGDRRGRQSAALSIMGREAYAALELRVDEHVDLVAELRRVLGVAREQLVPFVAGMPTRQDPGRAPGAEVTTLLLMSPAQRPGGHGDTLATTGAVLSQWLGADVAGERLAHNLELYRGILAEIGRLRELDLSAMHPAIIFDPLRSLAPRAQGDGA